MVCVKIATLLRLGDLRHHGYNNNHVVKVRGRMRSWLKETNVDWQENKQGTLVFKSDILLAGWEQRQPCRFTLNKVNKVWHTTGCYTGPMKRRRHKAFICLDLHITGLFRKWTVTFQFPGRFQKSTSAVSWGNSCKITDERNKVWLICSQCFDWSTFFLIMYHLKDWLLLGILIPWSVFFTGKIFKILTSVEAEGLQRKNTIKRHQTTTNCSKLRFENKRREEGSKKK